ncbi:hypothetical protein [Streptomyces sp. NPDC040750]|uniref:hypothetical protein n=1 Tax=Streptomyces sp. NPDC040750 TaxID=3154491 RepID=UPI0033CEE0DA
MAGHWTRGAAGAVLALVVGVAAVGCSDSGSPSDTAGKAASEAASAASSLASQGTDALDSARAEAKRRLAEVKGGVDAKDDVTLGAATLGGDGKVEAEVSARNTAESAKSFAVRVDFRDKGGNLLDVVVVTLKDVPAGASRNGTARGNRKLTGAVRATVGTALRY